MLLLTLPIQPASAQGDTIKIDGNTALSNAGFPGTGTPSDPYVIAGREITPAGGYGIELKNTDRSVVIRDVTIIAGGKTSDAIRLINATNVVIERADLQFNRAGIVIQNSNGTIVRDSTIRASVTGISVEGTARAMIVRNQLAVNDRDVAFASTSAARLSTLNVFRENNLSIATGQFGFHFQNVAAYDNDIDSSNVVNYLPVRWHTNVTGTQATPRVITDEAAYVKGMTNVGQVVCYNCAFVRFQNVNASSGIASGLVIEKSRNVTLANTFAEGNDVAGIQILNSANVVIETPAAYANRVGVLALNVTNLTIEGGNLAANTQGVSVTIANDTRIQRTTIEQNTDGIVLDRVNRTVTELNTIRRNTGDGIRVIDGQRNAFRNETVSANGGAGVLLSKTINATVATSTIENNTRGGVVLGSGTFISKVTSNTIVGNKEGGIWINGAGGANQITGNALSFEAKHIRLTKTEGNILQANDMTADPGETGFWFDDEQSYLNEIPPSNLVGGTPVQWHVALVGSPNAPITLSDIRSEAANVTNIAQVMVYKSSYVRVEDTLATNGTRGIYVLSSSSITIRDSELRNNSVGLEIRGTQTGEVRRLVAAGSKSGVLLADTLNISISDVSAPGSQVAVEFADVKSRGSVVERINATGTTKLSVVDPTAASREPRHLITDAGLNKLVGADHNASFTDAIGVARFGSERILRHEWDFGDGETLESSETPTLRPVHHYAEPGNYTATYTVQTADGLVLTDSTRVRVVPPPPPPPTPFGVHETGRGRLVLNWTIPESEFPITGYKIYRGTDPANMTLLAESKTNTTTATEPVKKSTKVYFAVTAIAFGGESARSETLNMTLKPPPPPEDEDDAKPTPTPTEEEKGSPLPGLPLIVAVVALAAIVMRRRRE